MPRECRQSTNNSDSADIRVEEIASRQKGLVTTAELQAAGLNNRDISYRVRTRRLHPLFAQVYLVGHRSITCDTWFLGATLSAGDDSGLGFYSAVQHYELWDGQVGKVHVVSPRRLEPQARLHPHSVQSAPDYENVRGIRVVKPALAVLQFAAVTRDISEVRRVAREAQVKELVTHDELLEICANGARGAKRLRLALGGGAAPTRNGGEDAALGLIRSCGLDPLVNAPLHGYVPDFYLPEHRLVIEYDGRRVHDIPIVSADDRIRQAVFEAAGERVLRIDWVDVKRHREQTRRRILAATVGRI